MANILAMLSVSRVVQAIIVGGVLAFLTANIMMNAVFKAMSMTANDWSAALKCGQPGNGIPINASLVIQPDYFFPAAANENGEACLQPDADYCA